MIGNFDKTKKKCKIIGAGLSGLTFAYFLKKSGFEVKLLEKEARVGGLAQTVKTEFGEYEEACHILKSSQGLIEMLEDLEVPYSFMPIKKKYILYKNNLKSLNLTPLELLIAIFKGIFLFKKTSYFSLEEFCSYHFGKKTTEKMFNAIARGTFGIEVSQLSSKTMFLEYQNSRTKLPFLLYQMTKKRGNSNKLILIEGGIKTLLGKLYKYLANEIELNQNVENLVLNPNQNTIIATPAYIAGKLLNDADLTAIKYTDIIQSWGFFNQEKFNLKQKCIGFLNAEKNAMLYGTLMTGFYKKQDFFLTTNFYNKEAKNINSEHIKNLGFSTEDAVFQIAKYKEKALPIYAESLFSHLEKLKKKNYNCLIIGNYCGEISFSKIADLYRNYLSNFV